MAAKALRGEKETLPLGRVGSSRGFELNWPVVSRGPVVRGKDRILRAARPIWNSSRSGAGSSLI